MRVDTTFVRALASIDL